MLLPVCICASRNRPYSGPSVVAGSARYICRAQCIGKVGLKSELVGLEVWAPKLEWGPKPEPAVLISPGMLPSSVLEASLWPKEAIVPEPGVRIPSIELSAEQALTNMEDGIILEVKTVGCLVIGDWPVSKTGKYLVRQDV